MKNKTSFTECLAAYITIFIFLFPDVSASAHALSQKPWQEFSYESASVYSGVLATNDKTGDFHAVNAMSISGDVQTVFLGGHANDVLNKPTDDVIGFEIENWDLETNAHITFLKSKSGPVGVTINGQHYFDVKGSSLVVSSAFLGEGHNTVLFSSSNGQPVAIENIRFATTNLSADGVSVLQSAAPEDFTLNQLDKNGHKGSDNNSLVGFALKSRQTAAIPRSLSNVTRGATAYRSSQQGQIVSVKIGVNRDMSESQLREAQVMFFEYQTKSWQQAFVKNVDHATFMVEADVPGGTDYFVAMIKTPEMPEASAFMPTAISDLEPATPAAGINLIQPPSANQQGDAVVSYPIAIPAGRQGLTPQVSLTYNSSGSESWCGYGWNIATQSISVDTRWGVPTFDPLEQSEVYLYNGVTLHGENGEKANRPNVDNNGNVTYASRKSGTQRFFTRVQSAVQSIERHGNGTDKYYWIVTDADQTKFYYGTTDGVQVNLDACLETQGDNNISQWFLTKVEDKWGNYITYNYRKTQLNNTSDAMKGGVSMYLESIQYTGFGTDPGNYSIHFQLAPSSRKDSRVALNSGLKIVDNKSLDQIVVKYAGTVIKSYKLHQSEGSFFKTRLDSVSEMRGSTVFYTHSFEYKDVASLGFSSPTSISLGTTDISMGILDSKIADKIGNSLIRGIAPSPISRSSSKGWSFGGTFGAGITSNLPQLKDILDRSETTSGSFGFSENQSRDLTQLIDVNGDGLIDFMYLAPNGKKYYRAGQIVNGRIRFSESAFSIDQEAKYSSISSSINFGLDHTGKRVEVKDGGGNLVGEVAKVYVGVNYNQSTSTTNSFYSDYNADGIIDYIYQSDNDRAIVKFGSIDNLGKLRFSESSIATISPVIKKETVNSSPSNSGIKPIQVVRIWEAPQSGTINISGQASMSTISGNTLDGDIKVAIQHNGNFLTISNKDWNSIAPLSPINMVYNSLDVSKGDLLMFRSNQVSDGQKDFLDWDPSISYTNNQTIVDGAGNNYSASSYTDGFIVEGRDVVRVSAKDTIEVTLQRDHSSHSADLHYKIIVSEFDASGDFVENHVFRNTLIQGGSFNSNFKTKNNVSATFIEQRGVVSGVDTASSLIIEFELEASSNVKWPKAKWRPIVTIDSKCDSKHKVYPNVNYSIYNKLHTNESAITITGLSNSVAYEVFPEFSAFGWAFLTEDHKVYMAVKSGDNTIAEKALMFTNNGITTYEVNNDGSIGNSISNSSFNGGNSSFLDGDVVNSKITVEFNIAEGYQSEELANKIFQKLQKLKVKSGSSTHVVYSGSDMKRNIYYTLWEEATRPFLHWGQFAWSPSSGNELNTISIAELKNEVNKFSEPEYEYGDDGPDSAHFVNMGIQDNPSSWNFFSLQPTRGEHSEACRTYIKEILPSDSLKDRWAFVGSHIGTYRLGKVAPGVLGESERSYDSQPIVMTPYSAYGAINESKSYSLNAQYTSLRSPVGLSGNIYSKSALFTATTSSFMDLNGDQFPDVIQTGDDIKVQMSNPSGGHIVENQISTEKYLQKSLDGSLGISKNAFYLNEKPKWAVKLKHLSGLPLGASWDVESLIDVNGDGLPDRIEDRLNANHSIQLNNGHGFEALYTPNLPNSMANNGLQSKRKNFSESTGGNLFGGMDYADKIDTDTVGVARSWSIGLGANASASFNNRVAVDLNGDGLVDALKVTIGLSGNPVISKVYLNTGTGFQEITVNSNAPVLSQGNTTTMGLSLDGSGTGSGFFPTGTNKFLKFSLSLRGGVNYGVSQVRNSLRDMNGDGAVDYIVSNGYNSIEVYYNQSALANKLQTVNNPLGGSFEITYDHVGNKRGDYEPVIHTTDSLQRIVWDMPNGKWVMSQVTINDGLDITYNNKELDGIDQQVLSFKYDGGIHSRRERGFTGFTRVETIQENQNPNGVNHYPKRYLSEVVEYFRPDDLSVSELRKHEYRQGLVRKSSQIFHRDQRRFHSVQWVDIPGEHGDGYWDTTYTYSHYDTLLSVSEYEYEFRNVAIHSTSGSKGLVIDNNSTWDVVPWSRAGETSTLFPAIVQTTSISWPQKDNRANFHEQKFDIEYDKYYNVTMYKDYGVATPGSASIVPIDTVLIPYYKYIYQDNLCSELSLNTTLSNADYDVYVIPCSTDATYSTDTIWVTKPGSDCIGDPFGITICRDGISNTLESVHRKLDTLENIVYEYQTNTIFNGARIATLEYFDPVNANGRTAQLKKHSIYLNNTNPGSLKRQSEVTSLKQGNAVKTFKTKLNSADWAYTDLQYDTYGNVTQVKGAQNHKGQRGFVNYSYDNIDHQFIETIANNFGESICNQYDHSTGLLERTLGINGHAMQYEYDQFQRLINIWAPRELLNPNSAPSVNYSYDLENRVAVTTHNTDNLNHYNVSLSEDDNYCHVVDLSTRDTIANGVKTATFIDGLGKAVQIKTTKTNSATTATSVIVSGIVQNNRFGKPIVVRADFIDDPTTSLRTLTQEPSDILQKDFKFDYSHRQISAKSWTPAVNSAGSIGYWTESTAEFVWDNHDFTTVSQVNSNQGVGATANSKSVQYLDSYGRTVKSVNYNGQNLVTTQFEYNGLSELLKVTNPLGLETDYSYDLAGRQTQETHPDRGTTNLTYDKASNVITIENEATMLVGDVITLSYDYGRLVEKMMPSVPGAELYNVQYEYGYKGDGKNGAGRVVKITQGNAFKVDKLKYDELGNVHLEEKSVNVPNVGVRDYTTRYIYDSFGRILRTVYPDNDQVDYAYTSLGELSSVTSFMAGTGTQDILSNIKYDGFGNISEIIHGNGAKTTYSYSNVTRTLLGSEVFAKQSGGSSQVSLLDRNYTYNNKGMISQVQRTMDQSLTQGNETQQSFNFTYDALNRLSSATSTVQGQQAYSNQMSYNDVGGILNKNSNVTGSQTFAQNANDMTYSLDYTYNSTKKHQLDQVDDQVTGDIMTFSYNSSGSISEIQKQNNPAKDERFLWNYEQWLIAVENEQGIHHYIYDHSGERVMKSSLIQTQVQINDEVVQELSSLDPYTLYVNPYYVITSFSNGDKVSKHYYMGMQRVATDVGITVNNGGASNNPESVGSDKGESIVNGAVDQKFEAVSNEIHNDVLVNIRFIMTNFGQIADNESFNSIAPIESLYPDLTQNAVSNATTDGLNPEPSVSTRIIYWYHPDYVGNVDLVTDLNQEAYEFYLYNPWGESLYHWESGSSSWNSPYRFNSKEFDAETGMHYYGARYHHPKLSVWMSVDPLVEQTMESYIYSGNNAITLLDPDGKWPGLPAMVKHFKYLFHETAKSMAEADYDVIREEAESYASRSWTSEYFTPTRRKIKPNVEVKLAGDGIKDVYFGNEVKGNADLNIEGIKVSGSFYGHLKSAMRYYNVHSIEFDAGSQGTGQASTTSGESGFVVEMIGGKNDDVVFHFVIQDKSIFNQLKALHNSKVNREYDRLVNSDPLVKDYMALRRAYNEYRSYYDKLHNGENEITEIQKKKLEGLKNTYNELVKKFFEKHGS